VVEIYTRGEGPNGKKDVNRSRLYQEDKSKERMPPDGHCQNAQCKSSDQTDFTTEVAFTGDPAVRSQSPWAIGRDENAAYSAAVSFGPQPMELKMPSDLIRAEPKREIVAHNNPAVSATPRVDPRKTLGLHRINSEKSTMMNKQWALKRRSIEDKYGLAALPIVFLSSAIPSFFRGSKYNWRLALRHNESRMTSPAGRVRGSELS
jgi:hypothetical protein